MGYDARFVADWNDHVWTEIFSTTQNRWLHCDSCENICDQPLIYEKGWKKLNNYIIAFSKDEIQDVTWRYTCDFDEVLKRRTLCRETWLCNIIVLLNDKLQKNAPAEYKKKLYHRRVLELAEFLTPPKYDGEHYSGRNSGSLEWRLTRKETEVPEENAYEFKLCCQEIDHRHFHIKYNCASDKYVRISDNLAETGSWTTYVFSYNNIFRKVEHDWNTVYLCRTEGSSKGSITWKFNFEESGLIIRTLRASLNSTTFESGNVKWFISTDSELKFSKIYEAKDVVPLKADEFRGSTNLTISAELVEGSGNQAWQHAQLFRQTLDSSEFPFEVEIFLDKQ
ncbi:Peptide-N(4)-(N-acetyl-beta-glucosaminyl)asparagine amidase, partial [Stegodyphus mimosarum]